MRRFVSLGLTLLILLSGCSRNDVDPRVKGLEEVTLFGEVLQSGEDWATYAYSFGHKPSGFTQLYHTLGPTESVGSMEQPYLEYVSDIKKALLSAGLYTEISDNVEGDYALTLKAFDLGMSCNYVLYNHIFGYQSVCCAYTLDNSQMSMLTSEDYSDMVTNIQLYTGVVIDGAEIENAVSAVMQAVAVGGNYVIFLQDDTASVSVSVYNFGTVEECWRIDSLVVVDAGLTNDEWLVIDWEAVKTESSTDVGSTE